MNDLINKINKFKKDKNAVILVHNYQRPEIYEIADFIGDSFELSKKATQTSADIIVFCGVDFMAESAYILNPEKMVLLPTKSAQCPMAAMVNAEALRKFKKKHPGAAIVSYVNTTAEVKAESDICCTSANAVSVVNSLKEKDIIFVPDQNLASFVSKNTSKNIIPWPGWCYVHQKFSAEGLKEAKKLHPDAKVVVHPECKPAVIDLADHVTSTSGMIDYVEKESSKEFIVATEIGLIKRLKLLFPEKKYYQAPPEGICTQMKQITLELVLESLEKEQHQVVVPEEIRVRAKKALDKMLKVN